MKKILIGLLALMIGAAALWMASRGRPREWSTHSSAALAEFHKGLEASMKYYHREAREHFEQAIAEDPDFAAPRLYLLNEVGAETREAYLEHLRQLEVEELSPREQFLVRYQLARFDQQPELADEIISEYLEVYPDDPFALSRCSEAAWLEQDWERATKHDKTLIAKYPNWVAARNRLGYMAMAQGRFEEAEELFVSYQYIAPDQANPHDSLGELKTVTGRYDEAREELERALAIKPDFCTSYQHLLDLAVLTGRPDEADGILARAEPHCDSEWIARLRCHMALWKDFFAEDYEAPWRPERRACMEVLDYEDFLIHRMAALTGRSSEAQIAEAKVRAKVDSLRAFPFEQRGFRAISLHMRGFRRMAQGEFDEAVPLLRKADDLFVYWGNSQGIIKLYNRLHLAYAYEREGETDKAQELIDEVGAVNPEFVQIYPDLKATLDRG